MTEQEAQLVQKEEVANFSFPADEITLSDDELSMRQLAYVVLKQGVVIPKHRIHKLEI